MYKMYSVSERVRRGCWSPTTESEAMTISPLPEDWSPVMGPEEVIVTDITINSLTVTFREALVARGILQELGDGDLTLQRLRMVKARRKEN